MGFQFLNIPFGNVNNPFFFGFAGGGGWMTLNGLADQ